MEVKLYDKEGKEKGNISLNKELVADKVDRYFLHEVVRYYLASKRVGTVSTKTRAEVSGGGRKPWKQKHTGRARQGSIRSPLWKGGGVVFGPKPRDFSIDIPQKKLLLAIKQILKDKIDNNKIYILESLSFETPKTKNFINIIKTLSISDKKILVVLDEMNENTVKSIRNIDNISYVNAYGLNAYDLLSCDVVIMSSKSLDILKKRLEDK